MYNKNCIVCGKEFSTKVYGVKYCSHICANNNIKKNCIVCGKEFFGSKSKKFCSEECFEKTPNGKKKYKLICKTCGCEFLSHSKNSLYCGLYCRLHNKKRICFFCGKDFLGRSKQVYCSKECYDNSLNIRKEKTKQTNLVKYGVENTFQAEQFKEKIKNTNINRYGASNPNKLDYFLEKKKKTCIEKYGETTPLKCSTIKEKIKNTCIEKYGSENNAQRHFKNYKDLNEQFVRENFVVNGKFEQNRFMSYFNIKNPENAKKYKIKFNITEITREKNVSYCQYDIYDMIKSFSSDLCISSSDRGVITPLELDIFISCKKIAIEFDGLMFHSFGKKHGYGGLFFNYKKETDSYHLNKTQLCEEKGIKLFHIFENEWKDKTKQEIWKSVIKNSLGYSDRKIFGRKCLIKQINQDELFPFLIENHLQGPALSSINYGLYYGDELVSVMTFGKSRFNKNYDWELIRFCNKINTNVIGSFSKLLKHFKKYNTGTIISYGNRRWVSSLNNVYSKNGGKLIKISKPNYYYFKDNDKSLKLESRIKYQKHKLKNILENFDESLSETENMYNNGFRKVYDCGNLVYEL